MFLEFLIFIILINRYFNNKLVRLKRQRKIGVSDTKDRGKCESGKKKSMMNERNRVPEEMENGRNREW